MLNFIKFGSVVLDSIADKLIHIKVIYKYCVKINQLVHYIVFTRNAIIGLSFILKCSCKYSTHIIFEIQFLLVPTHSLV